MEAGYSGTPLPKKLGIKPGGALRVYHAPEAFSLDAPLVDAGDGPFPVILAFYRSYADYVAALPALRRSLHPDGGLWIAWPKRASGVATDLTEDRIRDHALTGDLVDNKVCAIDTTWSGLRLVVRKELRPRR